MAKVCFTGRFIGSLSLNDGRPQEFYWDAEFPGLGLVVGKKRKTWIVQRGNKRVKVGLWPAYDIALARKRARELVLQIDSGKDPTEKEKRLTVETAFAEHIERLRRAGGSERTIADMEFSLGRYFADWKDRSLDSILKADCREKHRKLTTSCGPYAANRAMRYFRAVFNTALGVSETLPSNPCAGKSVLWNREKRRQQPIPWANLPAWRETIEKLAPIRRDFQLTLLFTGLRSTDAATIRWGDIDFEAGTIHRPCPKGGEDRAFTVPLAKVVLDIVKRRREENEILYPGSPWAFPSSRSGPLVERRAGPAMPSPHRLRDTFATAAHEAHIDRLDLKCLMNHVVPSADVTDGYLRPSVEHLREAVEKVSAFLMSKLCPSFVET